MRLFLINATLLVCAFIANAQNGDSDRCVVKTLELTGKKLDEIKDTPEEPLGSFETVIAEERLTTRVYRLPKTKLFVIASVWYTDESMASRKGADSISLELLISKSRRRNLLNSQHFADSEVPFNGFDVARVATMARSADKTFLVVMECRSDRRPVVTSYAQVPPRAGSTVEVLGSFSNVKHAHGDAFGHALQLWKEGDQLFGLLLIYTGAPADPPTGILEDVKFDARTRQLSFSARLSTGLVYPRAYSGVPSRERFTFKGVLTRRQVTGTLTRSDELFPKQPPTSKRIALRRSEFLTQVMIPPPSTYSAWKTWADEILRRRGPKW